MNSMIIHQAIQNYKDSPDSICYGSEGESVSYRTLFQRASSIADKISCDFRCKPIAVILERSLDAIYCYYASWITGNFYVPIDPNWPVERIAIVLQSLEPVAVLYDGRKLDQELRESIFKRYKSYDVSEFNYDMFHDDGVDSLVSGIAVRPEDPCYCIFTSGSTGTPKGVLISHRSLDNYIKWFVSDFKLNKNTVFGGLAQFHFDISGVDLYTPIYSRGVSWLIPDQYTKFPIEIIKYIEQKSINSVMWVPTLLTTIYRLGLLNKKNVIDLQIKNVFFAGEVLPPQVLNKWIETFPDARFVNMYGPTEATITCLHYHVDNGKSYDNIPIGKASSVASVKLLSPDMQTITPVSGELSAQGEIYIGGECLALGYWGDLKKTNNVFIQDPEAKNFMSKLYKTGDLGRYDSFGNILYCGRVDNQIKHRGYRIELGEIELASLKVQGVTNACAFYDNNKLKIMLALEVDSDIFQPISLDNYLQLNLPSYMLPALIFKCSQFPINSNGKVDRNLLLKEMIV